MKVPEPLGSFVRLIGALEPSFDDFHRLVVDAEHSRSARNAGFDFSTFSLASGHLLSTAAVQANPAQAVYCIEVTTDSGTDFQLEKSERETALPLPETANQMRAWVQIGRACCRERG